jgi:hypothetical protein
MIVRGFDFLVEIFILIIPIIFIIPLFLLCFCFPKFQ